MSRIRMAVVGAGAFGQNHVRVIRESQRAELVEVVDSIPGRADSTDWRGLAGRVDAAVIATPTVTHSEIGCGLLDAGIHVLVEKPMAHDLGTAQALIAAAESAGRVLAVGHLERCNPAVQAIRGIVTLPLFFEIHRMNLFAPRSLDVDVVLDLMIHDIDIVLALTASRPSEVRAAGIRILSGKVDIANVRLAFPGGCVANLTASRVSTEKVRKLRLFQPHQYISVDYARQDGVAISVNEARQVNFQPLKITKREPLAAQLDSFLDAVEGRAAPLVSGVEALAALSVSLDILDKIEEHAAIVNQTLAQGYGTGPSAVTN
ncbi:MAG: Gfo/Idh/MocA family oxidoreductase [Acidobacteria bacterium]|nr:Gfo/Idh/MocA family oxidoreductase [Acidobacteriota bacterium]